jgi:ABC-2 type transport system permease protein
MAFTSRWFIIPGVIAMIMMIIAALLTSLTVAREWERGTMEQLISTPVKPSELIIGKFIPYFAIGFFDLGVAVTMSKFVFDVPFRGSYLWLAILSALFLTGALSQGILISTIARTQLLASQLAILTTFIPTMLLSGFIYPIFNMPAAVQVVTYAVPARYYIVIVRELFLKGTGISVMWDICPDYVHVGNQTFQKARVLVCWNESKPFLLKSSNRFFAIHACEPLFLFRQ